MAAEELIRPCGRGLHDLADPANVYVHPGSGRCCRACKGEDQRRHRKENGALYKSYARNERRRRRQKELDSRPADMCRWCGAVIVGKRYRAKWCSDRCKTDAATAAAKARREANPAYSRYGSDEWRAKIGAANRKHGLTNTPTYYSWLAMLARCLRPGARAYDDYGARGITVCERWRRFDHFLLDMGVRPEGKTLDRIDGSGNYEPSNCRWATLSEQNRNRTFGRWRTEPLPPKN